MNDLTPTSQHTLRRRVPSLVAAFAIAAATFAFFSPPVLAAPGDVSGIVFEDIDGDALNDAGVPLSGTPGVAPNPGVAGAPVTAFLDDGDSIPNIGDTIQGSTSTGAGGAFSFTGMPAGQYWIVVDSKALIASQEPAEPAANLWAEQTYGVGGSLCADGAGGTAGPSPTGTCYGGRRDTTSDDQTTWYNTAEHLTLVDASAAAATNVDFGFSFNVVTNVLAGDGRDDDLGSAARTVQGSLRQFLENALRLAGGNDMRFIPVEPTNDVNGLNTWWRLDIRNILPTITDNDTTIDGRAYELVDGYTVRDTNPQTLGYVGAVGTGLDGREATGDEATLSGVAAPELEIANDQITITQSGLWVDNADNTTIRRIAIHGFGGSYPADFDKGDIRVTNAGSANTTIEENFIGTKAGSFADPGAGNYS